MLKLKLKLPILWPLDANSQLIGKDPDAGKDWRQEEKGMAEDEMVGWHHRLNGHEFEQTPGDGEGQGSLLRSSPWGCRVRHDWVTELNWATLKKCNIVNYSNHPTHQILRAYSSYNWNYVPFQLSPYFLHPQPLATTVILLLGFMSLRVSSIHSTYNWYHRVFVFLRLADFT